MSLLTSPRMSSELNNIFGGAIVGNILAALCWAGITIQVYAYYKTFAKDSLYTKLTVGFCWLFQGVQVGCFTRALYWYLVLNFSNPTALPIATWEFVMYQIGTTVSSLTVQIFFAHRVYSLSSSTYLGLLVLALVLLQGGLGVTSTIKALTYHSFAVIADKEKRIILTWLAFEVVADTSISAAMTFLLYRQRTGFAHTDTVINKMIIYSVNTGLVTSIIAIVILIAFARAGFHFVVLMLSVPFGCVYTITMLANLHSRSALRRRLQHRSTVGGLNVPLSELKINVNVESNPSTRSSEGRRPKRGSDATYINSPTSFGSTTFGDIPEEPEIWEESRGDAAVAQSSRLGSASGSPRTPTSSRLGRIFPSTKADTP